MLFPYQNSRLNVTLHVFLLCFSSMQQVKLLKTGKIGDDVDGADKPPASPSTPGSGEGDAATAETVNNLKEKVS